MSFDYFYGPDDAEQYSLFIRSDTFLIYRNPPAVHHSKLMFVMAGLFPGLFSKTRSQIIHTWEPRRLSIWDSVHHFFARTKHQYFSNAWQRTG